MLSVNVFLLLTVHIKGHKRQRKKAKVKLNKTHLLNIINNSKFLILSSNDQKNLFFLESNIILSTIQIKYYFPATVTKE